MFCTLNQQQGQHIESLLADLLSKAEANASYLCDRGGNILVQHCSRQYNNEENIAALAAGSFFATREVASLVGEDEFRCVFHQGETNSVFMQSVSDDLLLLVVFGKESNPGLVRLYANELCRSMDKVIAAASQPGAATETIPAVAFEIDDSKPLFSPARNVGAS